MVDVLRVRSYTSPLGEALGWVGGARGADLAHSRPVEHEAEASAHNIEQWGTAIHAAAEQLSRGAPETAAIAAALHALASVADAALVLTQQAVGSFREDLRPLDLELAGDHLGRAELTVAQLRRAYDALDIKKPT